MITKDEIIANAVAQAQSHKLDPELVLAFIFVESTFYPFAHRFEPKWKYLLPQAEIDKFAARNNISVVTERIDQMTSFGVMQVMGSVARELGHKGRLSDLYDPNYGINYGCLKLRSLLDKYPNSLEDAIASYNAGHPEMAGGMYANQRYVDDIKKALDGKFWNAKP